MRAMLPIAIAALLVAGCSSEPDFDERYETAEKRVRDMADELDKDMQTRSERTAGLGESAEGEDNSGAAPDSLPAN